MEVSENYCTCCTTTPKDQSVNYIILLSERALARNLELKISVEKLFIAIDKTVADGDVGVQLKYITVR